jgi:Na+/proline symporter
VLKLETAAKIRLMAGRAIRITSRIVFFLCGLVSLLIAVPYAMERGEDLPVQSEWIIFVVALGLIGVLNVAVTFLPRSWIARACKKDRDDARLFSAPLKLLGAFAAIFYVLALVAYFAPRSWNLNPQLMLLLCPMYLVKMTIDPPPVVIFFLLAPMNAAVYGALGAAVGYARLAFRGRR